MAQAVKCLLSKGEDLSLIPQNPHSTAMPGTVAWACNPNTGEVDTGAFLGLALRSGLLGEYQAKERLVSKTKGTDISQLRLSTNAYTHTWTVTRKSGRINIRKHKDDK